MNIDKVVAQFLLSPNIRHQHADIRTLKQSAVLIPIVAIDEQAQLILCKRSPHLASHPSQICFPGGKVEQQDVTLINTALRETAEEIHLATNEAQVLGTLPAMHTLSGYQITPVVANINRTASWSTQSDEVAHTFMVPLAALANSSNWQQLTLRYRGKDISLEGFMTPHGLLWGATAKIIQQLLTTITPQDRHW